MASIPESVPPVAGIILAAGQGSRMGGDKVLLPWGGQPLIRHIAGVALASRLETIYVIVGHQADAVADALDGMPVRIIPNHSYAQGQSTSLTAGVAALPEQTAAALIMLADQPLLTACVIDQLITTFHQTGAPIVAACSGKRRGNPVLFTRTLFPELLAIRGDLGARNVVAAHREELRCVEVASHVLADIDTPEAYRALLGTIS